MHLCDSRRLFPSSSSASREARESSNAMTQVLGWQSAEFSPCQVLRSGKDEKKHKTRPVETFGFVSSQHRSASHLLMVCLWWAIDGFKGSLIEVASFETHPICQAMAMANPQHGYGGRNCCYLKEPEGKLTRLVRKNNRTRRQQPQISATGLKKEWATGQG